MLNAKFLIAVLALGVVAGPARAQTPGATVNLKGTLDFIRYGSNAPFTDAAQRGYFTKYALNVTWDAAKGSQDSVTRVGGGVYDVGVSDVSTVIDFISNYPENAPKVVMIIQDRSPQVIISRKSAPLAKPADLIGRNLGGSSTDGAAKMFPAFLRMNGIDESKVQRQITDVRVRDQLLARDQVDGIVGYDYTSVLNLKALGIPPEDLTLLYYSDYGLDQYGQAVIVSRETLRRDPHLVKNFVRAIAAAWVAAIADPLPAVQSVAALEPITQVDLEVLRLKWLIDHEVITPNTKRNGLGAYDPVRLQKNIDVVVEGLNLPRKPAVAEVYDDRFLPPLSERLFKR